MFIFLTLIPSDINSSIFGPYCLQGPHQGALKYKIPLSIFFIFNYTNSSIIPTTSLNISKAVAVTKLNGMKK